MKPLFAFVALALAACAQAPDEAVSTSTDERSTHAPQRVPGGVAITEVGDLVGEYRVAGIDDAEIPGDEGIALSIDGPLMSFGPTCAGFEWTIGFEGEVLSTSRSFAAAQPSSGMPARPVCAVAVTPAQRALAQAIDAAIRAERTPANGIRLSGGGHSVTLFSQ